MARLRPLAAGIWGWPRAFGDLSIVIAVGDTRPLMGGGKEHRNLGLYFWGSIFFCDDPAGCAVQRSMVTSKDYLCWWSSPDAPRNYRPVRDDRC
jgi:hypothetical protein